jgi:hypothetical protein
VPALHLAALSAGPARRRLRLNAGYGMAKGRSKQAGRFWGIILLALLVMAVLFRPLPGEGLDGGAGTGEGNGIPAAGG